jgi:hypothetical protein
MKTKLILKTDHFIQNPENWLFIATILLIVVFMIKCVSVALTSAFSFDGAYNVQVAQNLEKYFTYSTNYQTNYDSKLFDPKISTGIPVLLPVAIIFIFFGESFASGLIVNAIYLILLAFAIFYFLKKCLNLNGFLSLLSIIMLYGTPNLFTNGLGLLGEVPMCFYLLMMLIFLHKYEDTYNLKYLFGAGLFIGLGYLTKTVILISIPALVFATTFDLIVKKQFVLRKCGNVKRYFKDYSFLPLGFAVPILAFEFFKLISLGITVYLQWWGKQWVSIMQFAGIDQGYSDTTGSFAKFTTHINYLSSFLDLHVTIIELLLTILLISFFAILAYGIFHLRIKQKPKESEKILFSNSVLVLITITLSYYGWWLLITPTQVAWERHIFVGYILLEICLILIASFILKYGERMIPKTKKIPYILFKIFTIGYIGLLLMGTSFDLIHTKNYLISFDDTPEKTTLLKAGHYIRNLPKDAEIFGYYWWQAPVVAFASGRTFDDILTNIEMRKVGSLNEKYFVEDSNAFYLDPGGDQIVLSQYDTQLIFSDDQEKIFIYKLNARDLLAYKKFTNLEKKQVDYSKIDFSKNGNEFFTRNVYINENAGFGKWAQDASGYLFKYNRERTLKMDLWFPGLVKYDQTPVTLQIYANGMLVYRYDVNQDGSQKIFVPLEKINGDTLEITVICNARYDDQSFGYPLAFVLNDMELVK